MAIDFSGVRYIVNGEPLDAVVLNRPIQDLVDILETGLAEEFASSDSPTFTGDAKTSTPAQFDNDTSIANTLFVQRALGNRRGQLNISANLVLTFENFGYQYTHNTGGNFVVTLPAMDVARHGCSILFINRSTSSTTTIECAGADIFDIGGAISPTNFVLGPGDSVEISASNAVGMWMASGVALIKYAEIMKGANFTTPSQFDNSTKFSTTEFVQRALGNYQTYVNVNTNLTLTDVDYGKCYAMNSGTWTVTLPVMNTDRAGCAFKFSNRSTNTILSIQTSGADAIDIGGGSVTVVELTPGESLELVVGTTGTTWVPIGVPWMIRHSNIFAASLLDSGYQKLPSGLIFQWWQVTGTSSTGVTTNYPIAFPNACLNVQVTDRSNSAGTAVLAFGSDSPGLTNVTLYANTTSSVAYTAHAFAVGY